MDSWSLQWLIGFLIVAFIARELFCWYLKMNEVVSLLKKQNALHEETNALLRELTGKERDDRFDFLDTPTNMEQS
ncbi:hypothetical protein [Nitratidesulfovibrio liaohensis]|uniref:ATP synthase F0 subunit 8 n=1 Tax=Nitratidesulfovibrio liaohensis TaxID=2604158 RepID=A0ABY9R1J2_9BACT|nr:hypothetical protein [Nitratidesulfovibrio liaohensis]WMW64410.1 hypothetical protein KPS_002422 [Nitratidesulfovibrio liaohensis]